LNEVPYAKVTKEELKYIYVPQVDASAERTVDKKRSIEKKSNWVQTNKVIIEEKSNNSVKELKLKSPQRKSLFKSNSFSNSENIQTNAQAPISELTLLNQNLLGLILVNRTLPLAIIQTQAKPNFLNQIDFNKIKFNVGIMANLVNGLDFSGIGIESGIQFPIFKKFSVSTGVGITEISRNGGVIAKVKKGNNESLYEDIIDFKQIIVPFHLNYNITKALSITSGVTYRKIYDISLYDNLTKSSSLIINQYPLPSEERDYYADDNFGISGGISLALTNHLNFKLNYEVGIESIFKKSELGGPESNELYNFKFINFSTNYSF